jgi:hypothetical protein
MNIGTRYFCLFLSLLLSGLTAENFKTGCYAAPIEYRQTMVRVLQETDVQGWPSGYETSGRYVDNITVSANGAKVGFTVKLGNYSDRHIFVMNADGSGRVDLTANLPNRDIPLDPPTKVTTGTLQLNDDGSRLFFWDYELGNIYYFDTSAPYTCHEAYKPNLFWQGSKRSYGLNSAGTVIYLKHFWNVVDHSHYGLVSTVVGSNVLSPVVDVESLLPPKTADYNLDFVDAARSGDRLLFTYYPDYWGDYLEALWESTPLQQIPNEQHNMIWDNSSTSLQLCHITSTDGSKALYNFQNTGSRAELHILNLDTGEKNLLIQLGAGNDLLQFPALSPDGTMARWGSAGYKITRMIIATGDLRDTFSVRFPAASSNYSLTDITSDNRYYFAGSYPGTAYIHRIDMAPVGSSPAPYVDSITFGRPQLIYGDTTPITVTVQVSDPKGFDNIQSVQMKAMVNGREAPVGENYEPLLYQDPLTNSGGGVFTGFVYPQIWFSYNTTYPLPMQVGVRIVVRNKDEHYTIADTSIMVHPASDVNPVQVLESLHKYPSLLEAFAAVNSGQTIQAREFEFAEELTFDRNIPVILKGGYDITYSGNSGYSTVDGTVTVETGALTLERIVVK